VERRALSTADVATELRLSGRDVVAVIAHDRASAEALAGVGEGA